nr:hypothetical protein [Candidatus Aenigmarchaeota archaeon]
NQASYNTGNGSVTTGDANVSLNLLNFLNSNFIVSTLGIFGILNIFGSWQGDLLLPKILLGEEESQNTSIVVNNQNTGANSTNDASANIENSLDIDNDNKADIKNNLDINGNTGGNTADFNTGNGSVTSGNSNILLNLLTAANKNFIGDAILFVLVNVLGTWTGDILFPSNYLDGFSSNSNGQNISTQNSQTGANSSNYSELNLSDSTEIENTNDGVLNNDININTNTGENSANYNTGSGTINSGDTNVITNIFNFLNLNVIAKKFVFLVVNVFGSWAGNIDVEKEVISSSNSESQISSIYNSQEQGHIKSEVKVTINSEGEVISSPSYHSSNQNQGQENSSETTSFELSSGNNNSIVGSSNHSGDPEETGNSFIGFIKQNLKIIMAILVVLYLIFLDIYLKRRKKAKSV